MNPSNSTNLIEHQIEREGEGCPAFFIPLTVHFDIYLLWGYTDLQQCFLLRLVQSACRGIS